MLKRVFLPGPQGPSVSYMRYAPPDDGAAGATPPPTGDEGKGTEGGEGEQKIPYARFKEVNDQLKAYKEMGDPEEIAQLIEDHGTLTTALRRQKQSEPESKPTKPDPKLQEKRDLIAQQFSELFGVDPRELKDALGALKSRQDVTDQNVSSKLRSEATALVVKLAKAAGYVDPEQLNTIENEVASHVLYGSDKNLKRFFAGDLSVVEEVFTQRNEKNFSKNMVKSLPQKRQTNLSTLNGSQGLAGEGKSQKTLSKEEINKLPPQQRVQALGELAWNTYHEQLDARREVVGE